jgi:hypothetical protein
MDTVKLEVFLQFPAMPRPLRVRVNARQLQFLVRHAEHSRAMDGTPIYRLRGQIWSPEWLRLERQLNLYGAR